MRTYHVRIVVQHPSPTHDSFLPKSLWQPLPAHPHPRSRTSAHKLPAQANSSPPQRDYRFGQIRIEWVDFESSMIAGKDRAQQARGTATATFAPHPHTKSGATNLPDGVVHVFRDTGSAQTENPPRTDTDPEGSAGASSSDANRIVLDNSDTDGVMLAVLAVPAWMTPSDFLAFVAPAAEGLAHLRMIRDSAPNRSLVLMKFRKIEDAVEFAEAYNGKPFNSMEPEICHVVHVSSVSLSTEDTLSLAITRLGAAQAPVHELPTCPVCLERMDSAVTGLVTVPCSHTFHCMCLSKWGDSRCPVCRYSQTLRTSHPSTSATPATPLPFTTPGRLSTCASCSSTTNLWICLVCGNIGCGRYGRAHAAAHYDATTHLYALELETQRVWDYAGDGYVHRLIQNKADGKLVELPSASMAAGTAVRANGSGGGGGPSAADSLGAEKIEAIGIEYSYLLSSQLDSQRAHFESQAGDLRAQLDALRLDAERERELRKQQAREQARALEAEKSEAAGRAAEYARDAARLSHRAEKASELATRLARDLEAERAVSAGLLRNLEATRSRAETAERGQAALEVRVGELEEQVRDVMFFLEARDKIEEGVGVVGEAKGGSVGIAPTAPSSTVAGGGQDGSGGQQGRRRKKKKNGNK